MDYVTVSAKIPRRLKELMERYNIKPGPIIREALEREVKRMTLIEAGEIAKRLRGRVEHIPDEEIARLIREDRGVKRPSGQRSGAGEGT